LIVIFLAARWYNLNTKQGEINEFAQGVDVESLPVESIMPDLASPDMEKVDLLDSEDQAQGAVRYQIDDDKVKLSVLTYLPELESGFYQVWFKEIGSDAVKKAFVLTSQKGGFIGSAAISKEILPFEVLVTKETEDDQSPEEEVLKATLQMEDSSSEE